MSLACHWYMFACRSSSLCAFVKRVSIWQALAVGLREWNRNSAYRSLCTPGREVVRDSRCTHWTGTGPGEVGLVGCAIAIIQYWWAWRDVARWKFFCCFLKLAFDFSQSEGLLLLAYLIVSNEKAEIYLQVCIYWLQQWRPIPKREWRQAIFFYTN